MTIFEAAKSGNLEVVKEFVDMGGDVNILKSTWTPLMYASQYGHFDVAYFLLERGANCNIQSSACATALMIASHHGWFDIVKLLLECKANPNVQASNGGTPLYYAKLSKKLSISLLFHKHSHLLSIEEMKLLQERKYRCRFAKEI